MKHLPRLLAARRPRRCSIVTLGVSLLAGFAFAAPAQAVVATVGSGAGSATVGLQPRDEVSIFEADTPAIGSFGNPVGNPVVHSNDTYAIYWDPTDSYHGDWQHLIDTFFQGIGAGSGGLGSVFAVDAQYVDKTNQHAAYNSTFRGAYTDTERYPAPGCVDPSPMLPGDAITCLTDQQLQQQLTSFVEAHHLQKGMNTIFYVLTPPGVTLCLDAGGPTGHCSDSKEAPSESYTNSFCSYHSDISPTSPSSGDSNTILYAAIPWTAGGLGDYHLLPEDRTPAHACQDGGFDPTSKPAIEQKEKTKEHSKKEEEEFEKKSPEEQKKQRATEALEGPHQQEPNQTPSGGPGEDGSPDTGLADLIINQISVEQQNTVTDPLLNAWHDTEGNEATDECRNFFAPAPSGSVTANEATGAGNLANQVLNGGSYYLNNAFNLAALKLPFPGVPCLHGVNLVPRFTAPTVVAAGDIVGFDGMESDISLNAAVSFSAAGAPQPNYPTFTWNFGDSTPSVSGYAPGGSSVNSPAASPCAEPWLAPCAGSAFHSYQYGGTYQVTLTVTDVGGNTANVSAPVTVVGPPPPSPPGNAPSGGASTQGATGGLLPGAPGFSSVPGPVLRAAATSRSLTQALRRGLLVNYSVNEQVAGHFEVLLNSQTARRLGIKGRAATGLPAGSAQSLVIGQALLITTKGGHSTVRIKFSKRTSERLRHVFKVTLMLRLVAHNAASQNPQSATVLSTFVLHR